MAECGNLRSEIACLQLNESSHRQADFVRGNNDLSQGRVYSVEAIQ